MTTVGMGRSRPGEGEAAPAGSPATGKPRPWLTRAIWVGAVVALLAATYLGVGYVVVPKVMRGAADKWAQETLHKPIRIGEIKFDPIHFTLDVQDLAIPADPRPMLAADRIHVRFSFLSLLHGPYTFDEVRLERPLVRAVIRADRSLNLGDLAPKTKAPQKSGGRAVRIGTFSIVRGQAIYADDSLPGRPETVLTPVAFTLKDFQTDAAAGGAFSFRGRSELGESLVWSGNLSTAPLHSAGKLQVTALRAQTIGAFLGPAVPATLQGGLLNVATAYDLHPGQGDLKLDLTGTDLDLAGLKAKAIAGLPADVGAAVDDVHVRLDRVGLALGGKDGVGVQASMPSATVAGLAVDAPGQAVKIKGGALTDVSLDTTARRLTAGALTIDGAETSVRRAADGRLSLVSLLPKPAAPAAPAPKSQAQPWSVHLASLNLRKAALQLDDAAVTPATHMAVSPIDLSVTDVDADLTKPIGLRLATRLDDAAISVSGSVVPATVSGDLKVAVAGLQIRPLLPYGPKMQDVELTSGAVSASGDLRFKGADVGAVTFNGQAAIDKISVSQPSTKGLLASWDAFRMEGLRYGVKGVTVDHAILSAPVGRVVVMADGTLNLAAVTGAAGAPPQPVAASTTPAPKAASQSAAAPALPVTVKTLDIDGGRMEFADLSIDPNFQAPIQALQGSLSNISTKPDSIADIDLKGQVIDQYSPVTIKGSMDLTAFDRQTDMRLTFSNIELPLFDPYSGKYAGYAIAKGKLTTELTYKIDHRMLKADHHVVIDQLQWGAATESKEKAPIPVRLATALLKDKNGVIDLDVPVTGTMDDPKFKVWPIIWQIVRQTLEKAAAAPFRLIGGLFAGADKAEHVDFDPGSAVLAPDTGQALGSLGKALAQRHELSIEIPAGPGLEGDATALANQRLDQALLAEKPKPATVAELGPDERLARLKVLYQTRLHEKPVPPAPPAPAVGQPKVTPQERKAMDTTWLQDRLRPTFTPSSAELQALGAARAKAVRDALLAESGVDPKQVFVTPQNAPTAEDGHARLTLKLQ
jgi:hypothetical protein